MKKKIEKKTGNSTNKSTQFSVTCCYGFLALVPDGFLVTAGGTRFHEIVALDTASAPSVNFGLVRRTSSKRASASLLKQAVGSQGGLRVLCQI